MSMTGGSVAVADNEAVSGSGLALAIYDQLAAVGASDLAAITASMTGSPDFAGYKAELQARVEADEKAARVALKRTWAKQSNALGPAIVAYIQANAVVSLANVKATVDTSTSVGKLPATLTPGDPIDAPPEDVELPVTGQDGSTALGVQ